MKKSLTLLIGLVFTYFISNAQECSVYGLNYQFEIDNFHLKYPGCKTIKGDLEISGEDIYNLYGLLGIETIKGSLQLSNLPNLESIIGLDSLVSIGDEKVNLEHGDGIEITGVNKLKNLSIFSHLKSNIFNLTLFGNDSLESLDGLLQVKNFPGKIYIGNNPKLTSLTSLKKYSHIGAIELDGANFTNMSGLDSLKSIENLIISNCPNLENLYGLNKLDSVENKMDIYSNPKLINFNGLDELSYVYNFSIGDNALIADLTGLESLSSCRTMAISGNPLLVSMVGLNKLNLSIGTLDISNNEKLTELTGLEGINELQTLWINYNNNLVKLNGLENLSKVSQLQISSNNSLKNLTGLSNLKKVKYSMNVSYNNGLNDLQGMQHIDSIAEFSINGNGALESLKGLENISYVNNLTIGSNYALLELQGIENLKKLDNLIINNNPALSHLTGCSALNRISGELQIINNNGLIDLQGIENIQFLNDLLVRYNSSFISFKGLHNLVSINNFQIIKNSSLLNLNGLDNLDTIQGDFILQKNNALINLNGIKKLRYIRNYFILENNASLFDLSGSSEIDFCKYLIFNGNTSLKSLQGLGDTVQLLNSSIVNNTNLSECAIKLFCDYYFKFNPQIINFSNNGNDCNTRQEVENKCNAVSTYEDNVGDTFKIYPNPGNGVFSVSLPDDFKGKLSVTNNIGIELINYVNFNDDVIDMSKQVQGIYYVKITSGDQTSVRKLIKN